MTNVQTTGDLNLADVATIFNFFLVIYCDVVFV